MASNSSTSRSRPGRAAARAPARGSRPTGAWRATAAPVGLEPRAGARAAARPGRDRLVLLLLAMHQRGGAERHIDAEVPVAAPRAPLRRQQVHAEAGTVLAAGVHA